MILMLIEKGTHSIYLLKSISNYGRRTERRERVRARE